jgi:site-specific DNA recombinase
VAGRLTGTPWPCGAEGTRRRGFAEPARGVLRFAFYGRVSTEDYQDPVTSQARQLGQAAALTAGYGRIVAWYFDVGQSRVLPWARRPQAAALLAAMADPDRGFDAIVVGEYERAFYGSQYSLMAPLLEHYGVQLWMPEAGGPVDFHGEDHEQAMVMLGVRSKREITRTRIRVRTAMAAQTREQGRYLGGRPPYGPAGRRRAAPQPGARSMGTARQAPGAGPADRAQRDVDLHATAGRLQHRADHPGAERRGHPVPLGGRPRAQRPPQRAGVDPDHGAAILANPRYTGHQVWNRQPTAMDLIDPANTGLGHRQVQRWGLPDGWVISARPAHPALVSEEDFIAAHGIRAARENTGAERRYRLAGLLRCGICKRRLESCWANKRAAYRCRHGYSSASTPDPARPKNLYIREDRILPHLPALHMLLAQAETAAGHRRRRTRREPTPGGRSPHKT